METALHDRERVGVDDFVLLEDYTNINAFVNNLEKRQREDIIYVSVIFYALTYSSKCYRHGKFNIIIKPSIIKY